MMRLIFFVSSLIAVHATAEELVVEHPPSATESNNRVYVRSTSHLDEHCFFNKEHDHIHCYDEEPQHQTVVIEERAPRRVVQRHTRYDPISTGVGVGIAIGLPLLVHHAIHDRHYRSHRRDYKRRDYRRWDYRGHDYRWKRGHHRSHKKHRRHRY